MTAEPRPNLVVPELLQGRWTTALICTFGANLMFFETRLMNQLAEVPLRLVLADNRQLAATLVEASRTGQRHRLANRAYVAAPIRHPRAAHAKLMLLLGPNQGRLIVGSGNLGYDGYASPGELWHVFAYSDDQPTHLNEFAAARVFIDGLASRELLDPPVVELLQTSWGEAAWLPNAAAGVASIRSNLDWPLLQQLRESVTEPVVELITHAPFHDADCAALQELIRVFEPQRVTLLVTDATSADPARIRSVLGDDASRLVERVQVRAEPAAYIHAKWVHLIHPATETLLTGSANLSRAALLRSSSNGNIEIGVISTGPRRSFDTLYDHLQRTRVADASALGITFLGSAAGDADEPRSDPAVLWSSLDARALTIMFDREVSSGTSLVLEDYAGRRLEFVSAQREPAVVVATLDQESADRVVEGGWVSVQIAGSKDGPSFTWPYQVGYLRGRLNKAGQREHLTRIGSLPEQDADLVELLRELDQTLIIDRESVWRIAKPGAAPEPEFDDSMALGLNDLDWDRVRRDPRYGGYLAHGRSAGLPPTDIQIMLAAIAGRLGDIGLAPGAPPTTEDETLAHEGDTGLSAESDDADEELEDELTRRRLPVTTRTRMAFDRFVRRYASALGDHEFLDELGPVVGVSNAVIFGHLLARLLERGAVTPQHAVDAQVALWRLLWGDADNGGIAAGVDEESRGAVDEVLRSTAARATTLRGVVASLDLELYSEPRAALRDVARHLLVDEDFGLDVELLRDAGGGESLAPGFLEGLMQVAEQISDVEVIDYVLGSLGVPRSAAEWRVERVRRVGRSQSAECLSTTFVLGATIDGLTADTARELLERVAVAGYFAGHDHSYVRVRFEGNGKAVAFWDGDFERGRAMIDDEITDFDWFEPAWPDWSLRAERLADQIGRVSVHCRTA